MIFSESMNLYFQITIPVISRMNYLTFQHFPADAKKSVGYCLGNVLDYIFDFKKKLAI